MTPGSEDHEVGEPFDEVYEELRRLAAHVFRGERKDHTLQPTALVHEAYLRLANSPVPKWESEQHFLRVAARAMRHVLINHAKGHGRMKRGGGRQKLSLDDVIALDPERSGELIALDLALDRLAVEQPRKAQVVELRYFGGLSLKETAETLNISTATVERDWAVARAWLIREVAES